MLAALLYTGYRIARVGRAAGRQFAQVIEGEGKCGMEKADTDGSGLTGRFRPIPALPNKPRASRPECRHICAYNQVVIVGGRDIITIGGSAGALGALQPLCRELPVNLPAALFVVIHRSQEPQDPDPLCRSLARVSALPVHSAADSQRFHPGNIYVCPPGYHLSIENGVMRVQQSPKEGMYRPSIDLLFRSAAFTYGRRTIGVLLTGMLTDGTAGLWQIKRRGG